MPRFVVLEMHCWVFFLVLGIIMVMGICCKS